MKIKAAWKYIFVFIGIALTAIMISSLFKAKPDCLAPQGQTVVKWKDMYWSPCRHSWNGYCFWPPHRKHSTYKITVNEGSPMLDERGLPILISDGKIIKNWAIYDSTVWNGLGNHPSRMGRFPGYEPIAENEYVVVVETRYRLFHNVEANLRICTQKP